MSNSWVTRFNKLDHVCVNKWIIRDTDGLHKKQYIKPCHYIYTRLMLISQIRVDSDVFFFSFDHSQVSFIIFFSIYLWPYYQTRWSGYTLLTLAFIYIDSHSCRRATLWCRDKVGGGGGGRVSACFFMW